MCTDVLYRQQIQLVVCLISDIPAATTIYHLSLHDALPICRPSGPYRNRRGGGPSGGPPGPRPSPPPPRRSEEHTSELQSRGHLVCRLLLEKKNRSKVRY